MKIVFVAHEFGLFSGHGGIASYLYNTSKYLLEKKHEVYVLCIQNDSNSDLIAYKNLHIISIINEIDVYKNLKKIEPDYVEVSDYLALCLYSLKRKRSNNEFKNTIFAVHHHTASRECFEWNSLMPIKYANLYIKECYMREVQQILLADLQIAPSTFMADYVKKNYNLRENVYSFNHVNLFSYKSKEQIIKETSKYFDYTQYLNSFNIFLISRIEGRKNQRLLIDQFIKFKNELGINTHLFLVGNSNNDEITGENYAYKLFKTIPEKERTFIHFFDFMNENQKNHIIAIGDLCVLPSVFESFSIALAETIKKGVPGMSSKYTGCKDYLGKTSEMMCFDPFKNDDLCSHLKAFYKLSDEKKKYYLKIQQETLARVTDPNISIENRLKLIKNFKENVFYLNSKKWEYIDAKTRKIIKNKPIILLSNHFNDDIIDKVISSYSFNKNYEDKIIVLNNSNEYLENLQDVVNRGLPILIYNTKNIFYHNNNGVYESILDFCLENQDKLTVLSIDGIKFGSNKLFTDYVFISSNKINLENKI